jgi:hypothetical protein
LEAIEYEIVLGGRGSWRKHNLNEPARQLTLVSASVKKNCGTRLRNCGVRTAIA